MRSRKPAPKGLDISPHTGPALLQVAVNVLGFWKRRGFATQARVNQAQRLLDTLNREGRVFVPYEVMSVVLDNLDPDCEYLVSDADPHMIEPR
ncbi:hypothetical protein DMP23_04975 [Amycolatopsis sp. A1MSW2902]